MKVKGRLDWFNWATERLTGLDVAKQRMIRWDSGDQWGRSDRFWWPRGGKKTVTGRDKGWMGEKTTGRKSTGGCVIAVTTSLVVGW